MLSSEAKARAHSRWLYTSKTVSLKKNVLYEFAAPVSHCTKAKLTTTKLDSRTEQAEERIGKIKEMEMKYETEE